MDSLIRSNSDEWIILKCAKELNDHLTIFKQLFSSVREEGENTVGPSVEHTCPIDFIENRLPFSDLILADDTKVAIELLEFVVGKVVARCHRGKEFVKGNIFVLYNVLPDGSRERLCKPVSLHLVDNWLKGTILQECCAQAPRLLEVRVL